MKLLRCSLVVVALAALVAISLACGEDESEPTATPVADDSPMVEMKDISFNPDSITVKVNSTVRWTNEDPVSHTVTDDSELFDSGVLGGDGTTFEHLYDEPGTYDYTCTIHPTTMKGTVIVEE